MYCHAAQELIGEHATRFGIRSPTLVPDKGFYYQKDLFNHRYFTKILSK